MTKLKKGHHDPNATTTPSQTTQPQFATRSMSTTAAAIDGFIADNDGSGAQHAQQVRTG